MSSNKIKQSGTKLKCVSTEGIILVLQPYVINVPINLIKSIIIKLGIP